MATKLETIHAQMQELSRQIIRREGEVEGLRFARNLLAEEAAGLSALADDGASVAAEYAGANDGHGDAWKSDALEIEPSRTVSH